MSQKRTSANGFHGLQISRLYVRQGEITGSSEAKSSVLLFGVEQTRAAHFETSTALAGGEWKPAVQMNPRPRRRAIQPHQQARSILFPGSHVLTGCSGDNAI